MNSELKVFIGTPTMNCSGGCVVVVAKDIDEANSLLDDVVYNAAFEGLVWCVCEDLKPNVNKSKILINEIYHE